MLGALARQAGHQGQPLIRAALAAAATQGPALLQQVRGCMTHHKLWTNPDLGSADPRVIGPCAARAPLPVVHSDENKASAGEPPHSAYPQVFGGLFQHGEPHNIQFSDDHASVTNELEKLLQVARELGGTEAVFKVVEQFGEGAGWSEMNTATAFRCLAVEAARMPNFAVEEKIHRHPAFQRLLLSAGRRLLSMSDDELGEVARACAALRLRESPLAAQVLWLELNTGGALEPGNDAMTAECLAGAS